MKTFALVVTGVIVDLETFNRVESIIEDHGLAKFMEEAEWGETLSVRGSITRSSVARDGHPVIDQAPVRN